MAGLADSPTGRGKSFSKKAVLFVARTHAGFHECLTRLGKTEEAKLVKLPKHSKRSCTAGLCSSPLEFCAKRGLNRLSPAHHFTMRRNFWKLRWIDAVGLYPLCHGE